MTQLCVFLIGTIIGSFLGLVIKRLPKQKPLVIARSECDHCNHKLSSFDLIPIVSFLFIKGKCRYCKSSLTFYHPCIEILTGISFLCAYMRFGITFEFIIALILGSILIVIAGIDIDTMMIHNRFQLILLLVGIIVVLLDPRTMYHHIFGMLCVSVPLFLIALSTQAMGGGDVKLLAVSGLILGYPKIFVAFTIACLLGGIYAICIIILRRAKSHRMVPFGPFLAIGIYIAYLYSTQIIQFYLAIYY